AIAIRGSIGMGFLNDFSGNAVRTTNSGASWSVVGNTGMYHLPSQRWMASSEEHFVLGGVDGSGNAAVSVTTTGMLWVVKLLDSSGTVATSIVKWAKSRANPGGRWVAILSNGDIYFADDPEGSWTKAQGDLGGRFPTGLTHNGERWIASGNTSGM